jgi:PAS domain S-box-containing protein
MTVLSAIIVAGISIFISFYYPKKIQDQATSTIRNEAQTIANIVATNSAPAVYFNDSDALNELIAIVKSNSDLRFVVITDLNSKPLASFNIDQALRLEYKSTSIDGDLSSDKKTQMFRSAVILNNHSLGDVYIGVSMDKMLEHVEESRTTLMLISICVFILGVGSIFYFSHNALKSLTGMANTFERVAEGDYSQRVEGSQVREIDRFAASYNKMVDTAQKIQEELQQTNKMLEHRIAERTKELQTELQQRKESEIALMESEKRYKTLIDHSSDGVAIYTDDKFVFVNPTIVTLLKARSMNEILGKSLLDFINPDKREEFKERLVHVLYGTEQQLVEKYILRRLDNTILYCEISAMRLHYHSKPSLQIILHDLTLQQKSEESKVSTQKVGSKYQSSEEFGILASGIAHDFANILSIIVTGVNKLLFLGEVNKESVANVAEHITKAATRGNALVKQLSTFAKRSETKFESVQVNSVILEIGRTLQQTFPQSISFDFRLSANVSPVLADSTQLHQMIVNLCLNARNTMPYGGKLVITTENVPMGSLLQKGISLQGNEAVCIKVFVASYDKKEELRKKILESVFISSETKKELGAGLEMVHRIMENHKGHFEVTAKDDDGTIYALYFPANEEVHVLKV